MARSDVAVLVGHASEPFILISDGATQSPSWSLPSTSVHSDPEDAAPIVSAVQELLGQPVTFLRMTTHHEGDEARPSLFVVEVQPIAGEAPPGHRWTPWSTLDQLVVEPREARDAFAWWVAGRTGAARPLAPPWSHAGWFAQASDWMVRRMAEVGRPASSAPRLHYLWCLSAVLRAESPGGALFMKASPPFFRHEGLVTRQLGVRCPRLVPTVVDVEPDEGWLLMEDHGGVVLGEQPPNRWAGGLETIAEIQRAWTGHTDELVALGARVRSLDALAQAVPSMIEHDATRPHLSADDADRWNAAVPALIEVCRRLAELGPPDTVAHGDLHPWNVVVRDRHDLVFDWTDAAVSHPFVDLLTYVIRTADLDARREMLTTYLGCWADVLPPDQLREAGDLALVVGGLYQVEAYLHIVTQLDPADAATFEEAPADWIRKTLRALSDGIDAAW